MGNDFAQIKTTKIPAGWLEVATALVKHFGLHEGYWRAYIHFGNLTGVNANINDAKTGAAVMCPAAFLPMQGCGLVRVQELDASSVDAAAVNPRPVKVQEAETVLQ